MKNTFHFLLLSVLFLQADLHAQYWSKTNGPDGGGTPLGMSTNGTLYAQIESYNSTQIFYKSTDNALTWQPLAQQPPGNYLHIGLDGNLYNWKSNQLYRSSDGGTSWSLIHSGNQWSFVTEFQSRADGKLFALRSNDMYRSDDSGASWQQVFNFFSAGFGTPDGFYADPFSNSLFTTRKEGGSPGLFRCYKSDDDGATWQEVFTANNYFYSTQAVFTTPAHIFIIGDNNSKLHRSSDGGATWQVLTVDASNTLEVEGLAATSSGRLLCTVWYKSYYSDDHGNTWQLLPAPWSTTAHRFYGFSNGLVLTNPGSIWRSTNNGLDWSFASQGIYSSGVGQVVVVDDNVMYASTYDGLFKTSDGGGTWDMLVFGTAEYSPYNQTLAANEQGHVFYILESKLLRSTDAGATFTEVTPPILPWETMESLAAPVGEKIFVNSFSGLWKSDDNGNTWVNLGLDAPNFQRMEQHPTGYLLAFDYGSWGKSTDGGSTWTPIEPPYNAYSFDFEIGPQGEIYTGGQEYFYWSKDDGTTWDSAYVLNPSASLFIPNKFVVNGAGHIFCNSDWSDAIWHSVDGGLSWNFLPEVASNGYSVSCMAVSPTQHLIVGTVGGGVFKSASTTTALTYATGQVFHDMDNNCTSSPADTLLPHIGIMAVRPNGQKIYGFSNHLSSYILPVEQGSYEVGVIPPSPYWETCTTPLNVPATALLTTIDSLDVRIETAQQCPYLEVELLSPFLRRCFDGHYVVKYCNKGTVTAEDASVAVHLDSFLLFQNASIAPSSVNGNDLVFPIGDVKVGGCGQFFIYFDVSCDAPLRKVHCSTATAMPDTICPDWTGPRIRLSGECLGGEAQLTIHNDGAAMGGPLLYNWAKKLTTDDWETGYGTFQLASGGQQTVAVQVDGESLWFGAQKPTGYPFGEFTRLQLSGCNHPDPGEPLNIASLINDDEPFFDESCLSNIGSFDPNDKQGFPAGISEEGYIDRHQSLEYLIRFQNTGTDTAFNVTIRDTLSPWLDPASVRLGATSHPCTMELTGSGLLAFRFSQIMLPDSNISEPASHGFLSYSINQLPGNPDGTEIKNRAGIYFDFNEPVMTNITLHTVGIPQVVKTKEKDHPILYLTPNPFTEGFGVEIGAKNNHPAFSFRLFDPSGRLIGMEMFSGNRFSYNNPSLPPGVFYVEIRTDDGQVVGTGKVVKMK